MSAGSTPRRALDQPRTKRGRGLMIAGLIALVLGLGALSWSVWDLFLRPVVDPAQARAAASALREEWASTTSSSSEQEPAA
ncbi:MAG: hypothetical protein Q4F65_14250, partial [Propionibacteriaceae bacterium]|nr:hypothetical protein [Propionibacteriaceae bacterium]